MRAWTELVATLADHTRGGVPALAVLTLLAATIAALALYFWPHWLPWRWRLGRRDGPSGRGRRGTGRRFRIGVLKWRWRLRWRRRRRGRPAAADPLSPDQLPDLPAGRLALSADELAAAGRYAEAVRERLRAIVRELIDRDVITYTPGWTVTELAGAATASRPDLSSPLYRACRTFSEIWYGQRPATRDDDLAMREQAEAVRLILAEPVSVGVR